MFIVFQILFNLFIAQKLSESETWNGHSYQILRSKDMQLPLDWAAIADEVESLQWEDAAFYYDMMACESRDLPVAKQDITNQLLDRVEKFVEHVDVIPETIIPRLKHILKDLTGQDVVLWKDKLNFKRPGSTAYEPHQDFSAKWWLDGQSIMYNVGIAIDNCSAENGCLEVGLGYNITRNDLFAGEETSGAIPAQDVENMDWKLFTLAPGEAIVFTSFTPHRSAKNLSGNQRRMFYFTFSLESEGDLRESYFASKFRNAPPAGRVGGNTAKYLI